MTDLQLTIARVPAGSTLATGLTFPLAGPTLIGRAPEADLVLADRTVSRRHARIWPTPSGWRVANRSRGNGIFVDQASVAPGAEAPLPAPCRLQIGGIIFAVDAVAETVPVNEPIIAPRPAGPALVVRRDGDGCTAHWQGRLMALPPVAALVLFALARQPAAVVHEWDIQQVVGRACNLPQAISAIRRGFRALIREGATTVDALAALIARASAEEVSAADPATLARQLVRARRRHGYALLLPATAVRCDEAG